MITVKRKLSDRKIVHNNSQKVFSKRYENELKATTKYLKENYGSDVIIHHKMSYTYFPRRIRAYSKYAKYICEVYGDKFEYIDIQKELSLIGSLPFITNLDILNNFFNMSLAIAIYILDSLKDCGCLSEAIMYIPSERELLNEVILPTDFRYPTYSNDLIKGVILLIENKNGNAYLEHDYKEVFYNEKNVNYTQNPTAQRIRTEKPSVSVIQSMNYSQRLRCLISFIPSKVVGNAEKNFKNEIKYCTELLLSEFDYIENSKKEEYESNSDEIPLSEEQKTALKILTVFSFVDSNRCGALNVFKSKKDRLKIENPYEVCFAAFYLLEYQGDDYAWLIELCGIIVEIACNMLPWYRCPDFSSQDEIVYKCIPVNTLNYIYYSLWDGSFNHEDDSRLIKETLSKIVYRKEGYILPQNNNFLRKIMFMSKGLLNIIMELCIFVFTTPIYIAVLFELYKRKDASISLALSVILLILFFFRKELQELNRVILKKLLRRIIIKRITKYPEIGFPQNIDIIKSKEEYEKELDELSGIIATQKNELVDLRSLLHNAEKTIEKSKEQYDLLKSEYDLNIKELIELRESIYKIQNSSELEFEIQKAEPVFPYNSEKRILIIGGHENWINSMKRYISNAVFINPSSLNFDTDLIKNVNVIWLQTNAMPHSLYYKIIDIARSNSTQIKYFMFSNAKKCATQIFLFEVEDISS